MRTVIEEQRRSCLTSAAAIIVAGIVAMMFSAPAAFGGESCGLLSGTCRNICGKNERAEAGAFEDCAERQECCVPGVVQPVTRCCIRSFDAGSFGLLNCSAPERGACAGGSGSPLSCDKLIMCRERI